MIDEYIIVGFDKEGFLKVRIYNNNQEIYGNVVSYHDNMSASAVLHSSIRRENLKSGQVIKVKRKKDITEGEIKLLYKLI